ncbi:hypothetical protein AC781_11455 [Akkermansia glycaniphila]|nr:hypothetical protein AC781_11455 [Akkermansia glycaniphila]
MPPPPVSAQVASPLVAYASPGAAGGEVGGMEAPYGFEQFVFDVRSVRPVWSVPDCGSAVGRLSRAERRAAEEAWRAVGPEFYQYRLMVEQFMASRMPQDEKGGRYFRPDSLKSMFREIRGVLVQAERWWKENQKYKKFHG